MTPRTILLRVPIWLLALCSLVGVARGQTYSAALAKSVYTNNLTGASGGPNGWLTSATPFNGTSTSVNSAVNLSTLTSPYAICVWAKLDAGESLTSGSDNVLFSINSESLAYQLTSSDAAYRGVAYARNSGGGYPTPVGGPQSPAAGAWHHYAAVVSGGITYTILDGSQVATCATEPAFQLTKPVVFGSLGSRNFKGDMAQALILSGGTATDITNLFAGPEPTLTSGSITIDSGGVTADTTSYSANGNGTLSYSYRWEHFVGGQWDDTGYSDKDVGPAEFGGVNGRDYRLIKIASNPGGTLETTSNTITYTAAKKRKVQHHAGGQL